MAAKTKPTTHDDYLATVTPEQRVALEQLRKIIRAAAPKAEECISYGIAGYRQNGMLVGYGASAKHCSFFLMNGSTVEAHKDELKGYSTSKGAINFQPDKPLPTALVKKFVKLRLKENG